MRAIFAGCFVVLFLLLEFALEDPRKQAHNSEGTEKDNPVEEETC